MCQMVCETGAAGCQLPGSLCHVATSIGRTGTRRLWWHMGTKESGQGLLSGLWLQNILLMVVGKTRVCPGVPLSWVWLSLGKESVLGLPPTPLRLPARLEWTTILPGQAWGACTAAWLCDMWGSARRIVPLETPHLTLMISPIGWLGGWWVWDPVACA